MAELGLAAAPVPSITVTFLSTVLSASAGALAAIKSRHGRTKFHNPHRQNSPGTRFLASRFFTAQGMEKKQQKQFRCTAA